MEEVTIRLQVFEGPLDLLLFLIDKNKVNIYDIPIVEITAQYMEYLKAMEKENLDILSEFLVMAATLVDIKCRMLLPKDPDAEEEEEDPRSELVARLLEYKTYKFMAQELKDRSIDAAKILYHDPRIPKEVKKYQEPVDLDKLCAGMNLDMLSKIFRDVMKRREDRTDPVRSKFGQITREEVSVDEKMESVTHYAKTHRKFSFRSLLEKQSGKVQVIVTFLVILELMKTGSIHVTQEKLFDDMEIESLITEEKTDAGNE